MKQKTKLKQTEIGMIPEDWEVKTVSNFCSKISSGSTPSRKKAEYWLNGNIPWLKTQELNDGNIYHSDEKITKSGLENSSAKLFPVNTILIAMYGATVGKLGILKIESTTNQAFCAMIVNSKYADYKFLFYSLLEKRNKIINLASGAAQQNLNQDIIKDFKLAYPSLPEQSSIAKILSSLDSEIELNQQMNKTLEAIGQAIFKHWFVDFEFPNEKGKPYKSSGGEMVESELGRIPKGWEVGKLGDEFILNMGQSPPGTSYNEKQEGVIFFQGRTDFGFRYPKNRIYCTEPTRFAEKNFTLLSVRAPVGDLNMALERCCIGRGLASIIHKSKSRSYTYYTMRSIKQQFESFDAEGTVFGSVSKTDLEKIKIPIPTQELVIMFEKLIFAIDESIENNETESQTLSQIRDSLLPKLMSGKIRVNKAETI